MATEQKAHREITEEISNAIVEAFNDGEPDRIGGAFTDDFVCHLTGGAEVNGPEAYKERIRSMRSAFPDYHKEEEILLVESDDAAVQYRWSGTHGGDFMGIPATGNEAETTSVALLRIDGDQLAKMWAYSDGQTLLQQLGVEE